MNLHHGLLRLGNIIFPKGTILLVFLVVFFSFSIVQAETYEAEHISWSGYWWPFTKGGLSTGQGYRGHPAPLEKYELLVNNRMNGPSIDWYEDNYYQPNTLDWAGLCPSWARASAYETYEVLPSSVDNIVFRVGDKKGLLTLCHDDDFYIMGFGHRPKEFHLWLLQYIKDEKRAFTADLSTGEEVWYYPIYRYEMQTSGGSTRQSVNVKIYYAADDVHPDYIGTKEITAQYTYTLDLNTAGDVTGGEWTGSSVSNHPEIMKIPLSAKAKCPYLDCDEIRRIAQTRDDFLELEDNALQNIDPGTYNLILLDSDEYILNGLPGDEFYFEITKEDGSLQDIHVDIYDTADNQLVEQAVIERSSLTFSRRLVQQEAPYMLVLSQLDNYEADPNIYTLTIDRKPAYRQHIPYVPTSSEWSGFALTNAGEQILENVTLVACNDSGLPQQTLFGPENILINEKKMLLFDDLPFRPHEYSDLQSLKLLSDQKTSMLNLFSYPNKGMGGFGCEDDNSSHLVIADTFYTMMGNGAYMEGVLINETFYEAPIEIRVFSSEGILKDTIEDSIGPGRNMDIKPGSAPFLKAVDGGWLDIVSKNGTKLSGSQYTRDVTGKKNAIDTLFALPVFTKVKYVPHIPSPVTAKDWLAELVLINPNDRINRISFHFSRAGEDHDEDITIELAPYEKQVIDLTSEFGKMAGEALSRSMLEIRGAFTFVGYYSYSSQSSTMKDKAGFPLIDSLSFKNELILPHVPAQDSQWWTGVGICNPNEFAVDVMAQPYDADGELIEDLVEVISLEPGAYDVVNARSLFSQAKVDISFIRFHVEEDANTVIGGFYLFGIGNVASLSGANM